MDFSTHQHIAVLWYGIEGQSTIRFLISQWVDPTHITVLDKNAVQKDSLIDGINLQIGSTYLDNLDRFDLIIKSPWITRTLLQQQTTQDISAITFTSQTQLFLSTYTGTTIWVTGTKGKSTIVSFLEYTLKHAWVDVVLAGNVGLPVLDQIDFDNPPAVVIYELSSFMLESLDDYSLDICVFNTFYKTHISEHWSVEAYEDAKLSMLAHADHALIGEQVIEHFWDRITRPYHMYGSTWKYTYTADNFLIDWLEVATTTSMSLLWDHNKYNLSGVVWILDILQNEYGHTWLIDTFHTTLTTFKGLEHRIEPVWIYEGIHRYNDAIATTPQATCAAIQALGEDVHTLFYGWIEGSYDHSLVIDAIKASSIRVLILFPDTGHHLKTWLDDSYTFLETTSLQEWVQFAAAHTPAGHIALLSCWSPSFSCWKNFREKWNMFKEAVRELPSHNQNF